MKRFLNESGRRVPAWGSLLLSLIAWLIVSGTNLMAMDIKGAGIWRSEESGHKLTESHEQQLLQNLKRITGLSELRFSENGQFQFGAATGSDGGSATARQVLQRAIDSGFVFLIEDHNESPTVNFGQMDEGTLYEDESTKRRFLAWRIRLDFDDFRKIGASREVRESFSIGFTFLHELLHGLGHRDAQAIEEIGECEELVNKVRLELELPTRDQYFAEQLRITGNYFTLRLRFRSHSRQKKQYLFFLVPPGGVVAELAESVIKARRPRR
ncbi:MAG: hypothetical protein ACKVZH_04095 [Blastocatellia bacterium]